ncbi:hypothetical protein OBBRIDRAFT_794858 [Obba rivulosa]|uniref:Zinc-finger domain-containing protein n=1 Tax=Obba rivulosa TaxID=1052685 RepID=A0A8E2AV09_9APHY|nr:hypothetical protein OBBRIDRAFT_794858 [Obba rivulosa]
MASFFSELANWDGRLRQPVQQPLSLPFSSPSSSHQTSTKSPTAMPPLPQSTRPSIKPGEPGPSSTAHRKSSEKNREPLFIPDDSDMSLESSDEEGARHRAFESRPSSPVAHVRSQLRLFVDTAADGGGISRDERNTSPAQDDSPLFTPRAKSTQLFSDIQLDITSSFAIEQTSIELSADNTRTQLSEKSAPARTFETFYELSSSPLSECPLSTAPNSPIHKTKRRRSVLQFVDVPPFPAGLSRNDYPLASEVLPAIQREFEDFPLSRRVKHNHVPAFPDDDYVGPQCSLPLSMPPPSASAERRPKPKKRKLSQPAKTLPQKKQKLSVPPYKLDCDAVIDAYFPPYEVDIDDTEIPPTPPPTSLRVYFRHVFSNISEIPSRSAITPVRHQLRAFTDEADAQDTEMLQYPSAYDMDGLSNADAEGEPDPDMFSPTPGITPDSLNVSASPPLASRTSSPPCNFAAFRAAHATHAHAHPSLDEYAQISLRGGLHDPAPALVTDGRRDGEDGHVGVHTEFGMHEESFLHGPAFGLDESLSNLGGLIPPWMYCEPTEMAAAKTTQLGAGIHTDAEDIDIRIGDQMDTMECFGDGTIDPSLLGGPEQLQEGPELEPDPTPAHAQPLSSTPSLEQLPQKTVRTKFVSRTAEEANAAAGPSRLHQIASKPHPPRQSAPWSLMDMEDMEEHIVEVDADDDSDYQPGGKGDGKGKGKGSTGARVKTNRSESVKDAMVSGKRTRRPSRRMRDARVTSESEASGLSDASDDNAEFNVSEVAHKSMSKPKKKEEQLLAPMVEMTSCHHCRRTTAHDKMRCTEIREDGSLCGMRYCVICILKRYPDIRFESYPRQFTCPKCRNTCNCTVCSRKRGEEYVPCPRTRVQLPDYLVGSIKTSASFASQPSKKTPAPPPRADAPASEKPAQPQAPPSPDPVSVSTITADWTAGVSWGTIYSPLGTQPIGKGVVSAARTIIVHTVGAALPKPAHAAPPPPPRHPRRTRQYIGEPQPQWRITPKEREQSPPRTGRAYIGNRSALFQGYLPLASLYPPDDVPDSDGLGQLPGSDGLDPEGGRVSGGEASFEEDPDRSDPVSPPKKREMAFVIADALLAAQEALPALQFAREPADAEVSALQFAQEPVGAAVAASKT